MIRFSSSSAVVQMRACQCPTFALAGRHTFRHQRLALPLWIDGFKERSFRRRFSLPSRLALQRKGVISNITGTSDTP
jgi:hypothetical protein